MAQVPKDFLYRRPDHPTGLNAYARAKRREVVNAAIAHVDKLLHSYQASIIDLRILRQRLKHEGDSLI